MNIKEYKAKQKLYEKFAEAVSDILHAIIKGRFAILQIQHRPKSLTSLEDKIKGEYEKDKDFDKNKIEETCHDLAGCRILFYYDDDVTGFVMSGLIHDNFKVIRGLYKAYYPGQVASANDCYTADRYVIELSEKYLSLFRYKKFRGLKCEIQIHTGLNHIWSETNHDILYKRPNLGGYGGRLLGSIDKQMTQIMMEHCLLMGRKLQLVRMDYQQILVGKRFLESDSLQEVSRDIDNNQRYEILDEYKEIRASKL